MITGVSKPRASLENRDRLGALPNVPGPNEVDWLDQPPVVDRGNGLLGKRIGKVGHHFRDVQRELIIEEAEGGLRHGTTRALGLKVVPEADRNPIDLGAVHGRLHAFGPRHVVDLKPPSRRVAAFRFRHVGTLLLAASTKR